MPKRNSLLVWTKKSHKLPPFPINGTPTDTQRTNERYIAATKLLQEAISKRTPKWASFEITQLTGEPKDFNDTAFLATINKVLDSHTTVRNKTAWEKCKRTIECAFLTMSPFAKVLLEVAQSNGSSMVNPYGLICSGLILLIKIAETEMARTDELERTLDYMCQQLEQLDIVRILPGDLDEYRGVINRAVDIRSACMVYIACHIQHDQTNFGLIGKMFLGIVTGTDKITESKKYLKSSVDNYSQALGTAHIRISVKAYELLQAMAKLTQPQTLEQKVDVKIIVPYQQNPYFTGRQAFLQDLKRKFHTQNPMQINHRIALHGMGGVGKTQCALAYIYANQNDYERIYWISGVNQASLLSGYQNIARKEGLQLIDSGSENPVEAARMTLSWLKDQRSWLLVIDNLDDIGIANQLLPENSPTTHTLITTRDRNAAGIPAEPFEVGVLDSTDAIQLLLNLSKISVSTDTPQHDQAAEIVQELGYLPLAIEQAAAYIREVTHDLHLYSQQYLRNRKALQKWVPKGNRQYTHSIATTWSMSFEAIRSHPQASKLLHLLAFLNPDGTMLEFLEAGADALDGDLRSMLGDLTEMAMSLLELEKSSIIKWDRGRGIIVLHRLVQVAVIDDMSPDQRDMNLSRIIRLFSRAFPMEIIPQTRHICRTYQNQILEPLLRITICTAEVASIKERVGKFLSNDGKYREAEELFLQAVGIRSQLSDPDDAELLASKLTLASIYWNQGRTTEAVKLEEEVLNTRKRIWGMENQSTLAAMNNLALTYLDQGRILEAMKLQEEVLKMERLVLGEDHVDTLAAMNNLAWTYRNQGRAKEAVELQEVVLERRRRILGEDDPATLKVMDTLALSYRDLSRIEDALTLQKAVLEARRRQLGEEHPHTLTATLNLASMYWDQNCLTEAAELEEHVLEMSKKLFGIEHRDTLTAMHNLGCTYRDQRRFAEAVDLQEQVLEKRQRTLGERHPDTLKTMHTLARTYSKDGSFERAAELEEEVVKMRKEVLGKEHPDTLRSLQHLAEIRSELSENEAVGEELALGKVHRHTEMLANNSQVNGT